MKVYTVRAIVFSSNDSYCSKPYI